VVEDDHAVVEGEAQVGQAAVVGGRVGQPLDVADRVVAGVADGPAAEARQTGDMRRAVQGELLLQEPQRVVVLELADEGASLVDFDAAPERLEAQERAGAEEAVPADALAADDALEEERPFALLNFAEGADRRERVAHELAVDGHQAGAPGQFGELLERGAVTHRRLGKRGAGLLDVYTVPPPPGSPARNTVC